MSSPPTHVSRSAEPSTTSGDGGLVLRLYIEPQFSYVTDSLIYGSLSGSTLRTIDQYDFSTGAYSRLLDLDSLPVRHVRRRRGIEPRHRRAHQAFILAAAPRRRKQV